ncbi:unnamed protein product [Nyctereutes procyonoides]|uniref:(raccoon dog) hypothetical protein n=1 Tax=Nyctereutes procyonoides TaxID=34880 RepID=A0A811Z880_NYCPR|nr:unnamed protein product [Nyctereutes procyonoides]
MLIKVKTLIGKEIEIDIELTDKVEGNPPQQQRLIYTADYKILDGSVLHLVLALRGGGGLRQ